MENERLCPSCNIILVYSNKYKKIRADKKHSLCKSCSVTGENNPMFGKSSPMKGKRHTEESRKKISENHIDVTGENNPMFGKSAMLGIKHTAEAKKKIGLMNKGKVVSDETKEKISTSNIEYYRNNPSPRLGIKCKPETLCKMRLSAIKRVEKCKFGGNQFYPAYNKKSIILIENYAKERNLNIIHAENGGEFYVEKLGYWVDAYDPINNVVIEYYEKQHKYNKEKDDRRRQEIVDLLNCEFIIIYE